MYTIKDFFDLLEFFKNNPDATIDENFQQNSTFYQDKLIAVNNSLTYVPGGIDNSDQIEIQTALSARNKAKTYFNQVLTQVAYDTVDYTLLRKYLIDWYSSHKTIQDLMRRGTDAFALPSDDIDLALQGFGAGIFNANIIPDRVTRALLLVSIAELYKIKGTPKSITSLLSFIGFRNLTLREWWVKRDPNFRDEIILEGVAIEKGRYFDDIVGQYLLIDPESVTNEIISWQTFQERLFVIHEPHWQYTKEEIIAIDNDEQVYLKLPSITPYYSIVFNTDVQKLDYVISLIERMLTDEFNRFINGDTYAYYTNITNYTNPVSIVELYSGFAYALIRADEDNRYLHFRNFLVEQGINPPEYQYRYSIEQLILWANSNVSSNILLTYVPSFPLYLDAYRELVSFWISDPSRIGTPIPEIYFSQFGYPRSIRDSSNDKILNYNGNKFVEGTTEFDYYKIFQDYDNLLNKTPFSRLTKTFTYKSTTPSQDVTPAPQPDLMPVVQKEFIDLSYHDIFKSGTEVLDITSHDGSKLLPSTPTIPGNWAIDDQYFYFAVANGKWYRWSISYGPPFPVPVPPASLPDPCSCGKLGYTQYDSVNKYIYRIISHCSYGRYQVETTWTTSGNNIKPDSIGNPGDYSHDDNYMYYCVALDTWTRVPAQTTWDDIVPRLAIFIGESLNFPIFDLTNRYDADRTLRGTAPVNVPADLDNITNPFVGQTILVRNDYLTCLPKVYEYGEIVDFDSSSSSHSHGLGWLPSSKLIDKVNLGMNNDLLLWIDEQASAAIRQDNLSPYTDVAELLLQEISTFINTKFRSIGIDLSSYFIKFRGSDALFKAINFFKPKRARLLFFAVQVVFDNRLFNSLPLDQTVDATKLLQSFDTFVSHSDVQFIQANGGLYNREYSQNSPVEAYDIGVWNHWNVKHPRPLIKATVNPGSETSSNWGFGFCKDYPRVIFQSGKLGYPETIEGDRFEYYDAYPYPKSPGQQVGPKSFPDETVKSGLNDEKNFVIKGDPDQLVNNPVQVKTGEIAPSKLDTTTVPGITIERPVYHRPIFISLKELFSECYPVRPPSCCDYYDVGCFYDGDGNPHLDRWNGQSWVATEESPVILEEGQRNTGDTYCTPCDITSFTPDQAVLNIPETWIFAGVYHNYIEARGYLASYYWINGTWTRSNITQRDDQYIYGYTKTSLDYPPFKDELVHTFNKNMGFHYWEVYKYTPTGYVLTIRSKLKNLIHTIDELNVHLPDFGLTRDKFLNGNDTDVCDDHWQDLFGNDINGVFSSSIWIRYLVSNNWGGSALKYPNSRGTKNQIDSDGQYLYQCVEENQWVRVPVQNLWILDDPTDITSSSSSSYQQACILPNSPADPEGIVFHNDYLYIYIDTVDYRGWVRLQPDRYWTFPVDVLPDSETIPTTTSTYVNGALPYVYWTIMDTQDCVDICGNIRAFTETYRSIWELYKKPGELWCDKHHVYDEFNYAYVLKINDAIRRILKWKINTWELFGPGEPQEATWEELAMEGITWDDLSEEFTGADVKLTQEEWDGIRSTIYAIYDSSSSSSSGGDVAVDGYLYWYNYLSEKYPLLVWPPFEPDLTKNSDADYWNVYEGTIKSSIQHAIDEHLRETNNDQDRCSSSSSSSCFETIDIWDDVSIYVLEDGELVPEDEWPYINIHKMTEDCEYKAMEDDSRKLLERLNVTLGESCPTGSSSSSSG